MDTLQTSPHPFYPPETEIIGYVANTESPVKLVSLFFVGAALALTVILLVLDRVGSHLRRAEKLTVIWFYLSGLRSLRSWDSFLSGQWILTEVNTL
jgi:cholestenol delta-isomerase